MKVMPSLMWTILLVVPVGSGEVPPVVDKENLWHSWHFRVRESFWESERSPDGVEKFGASEALHSGGPGQEVGDVFNYDDV